MSKIHVNIANEQLGPFSVDEVNEKLDSGEFSPSNKGWMDGMSGWKPLSDSAFFTVGVTVPDSDEGPPAMSEADKMKERGREAMEGAGKMVANIKAAKDVRDFLPYLKLVDVLLERFKNMFTPKALDTWDGFSRKMGFLISTAGAAIIMVIAVLAMFKMDKLSVVVDGAKILLVIGIGQYIAFRFLKANSELIDKSPGKISSKAFLKCFSVVLLMFGIWYGVDGIEAFLENTDDLDKLIEGIVWLLVLSFCTGVAMNHESVNVELTDEKTSIGEEALGILSFLAKLVVRVVPFFFFLIILGSFIKLGDNLLDIFDPLPEEVREVFDKAEEALEKSKDEKGLERLAEQEEEAVAMATEGIYAQAQMNSFFIILALSLPFLIYVGFLLYHLFIDLMRATLCLFKLKEK